MGKEENISPAQRNLLFLQSTRQNIHSLGKKSITGGQQTINFELPKARYMSRLYAHVTATINIKHATEKSVKNDFFRLSRMLQRVTLDLNNGFAPFMVDGCGLKILSLVDNQAHVRIDGDNVEQMNYCPQLKVSATGEDNKVHYLVELPLTLNDRDSTGLVLLQNSAAMVNLKLDFGSPLDFIKEDGFTVDYKEITVSLTEESFSVPSSPIAQPDLSTLKIVHSATHTFAGSGKNEVQIGTGYIYRKLALQFLKDDGNPFEIEDFTSNIDLCFNVADTPYSLDPAMLRYLNERAYGVVMPKGVFIFDFNYQGLPNFGGSRDLVDTEKLTSFALRFNSRSGGKVNIIKDGLVRLRP